MKTIKIILIAVIVSGFLAGNGICQQKQSSTQKPPQQNQQPITPDQAATIKKVLSKYDPAKLTAVEAKSIHDQFRQAGIHAGPETRDAIKAAGFDPDKLRTLDPPPDAGNKNMHTPPSLDEMLKSVEINIAKPLNLNQSQHDAVIKAYKEFMADLENLRKSSSNQQGPLDRSKVEPFKQKRDDKIKSVLTSDQFKKYQELEKANHPGGGGQPTGPENQPKGKSDQQPH